MTTEPHVPFDTLLAHREFVTALARALVRDPHDAADVAQSAWLRAVERPPTDDRSLRAWLRRVVRSSAADRRRAETRRERREQSQMPRENAADPADLVARAEIHRQVVEAVLALAEPHRSALLRRFFEGEDTATTAARDGVSEAAVRKRVQRALELLRERLDTQCDGDRSRWLAVLGPLARLGTGHAATAPENGRKTRPARRVVALAPAVIVGVVGLLGAAGAVALVFGSGGASSSGPAIEGDIATAGGRSSRGRVTGADGTPGVGTDAGGAPGDTVDGTPTVVDDAPAIVVGRVLREPLRDPVADAEVRAAGVVARTGPDGTFRLEGLTTDGSVALTVRLEGGVRTTVNLLALAPGTTTRILDIVLGTPTAVRVHVVDAAGHAVSGARVRAFLRAWAEGGEQSSGYAPLDPGSPAPTAQATTDGGGDAVLAGLASRSTGLCLVATAADGTLSTPMQITLDGHPAPLTLTLPDTIRVTGRVIDGADARPVAGADVVMFRHGVMFLGWSHVVARGTADTQGNFVLTHAPLVPGYAVATPPGGVQSLAVPIDPAACTTVEIALLPRHDLTGTVRDGHGPVADAHVTATLTSSGTVLRTRTDAAGRFVLRHLPRGAGVQLEAVSRDEGDDRARTARPVGTTVRGIPSSDDVTLEIVAPGAVEGRLVDGDGTTLPGVTVEALGARHAPGMTQLGAVVARGRSATDGRYRLEGLMPGPVEVIAQGSGHVTERLLTASDRFALEREASDDDPRVMVVAGSTVQHDLELRPAADIRGRVELPDGTPVAGVSVVSADRHLGSRLAADAFSGADGTFVLHDIPVGDGAVRVTARREHEQSECVVTVRGGQTTEGVRLVLGGSPPTTADVEGVVTAPGGMPRGTTVHIVEAPRGEYAPDRLRALRLAPPGRPVAMDADGRFEVRRLETRHHDSVLIVAFAPGRLPAQQLLTLRTGETSHAELVLLRGLTISGRLVTDRGAPAPGVPVRAVPAPDGMGLIDGMPAGGVTAADGSFLLEAVPKGHVNLVFGFGDRPLQTRTGVYAGDTDVLVRLPAGVDPELPVPFPESVIAPPPMPRADTAAADAPICLRGRIVDADGHVVAQVQVQAESVTPNARGTIGGSTDREGRFVLRGSISGLVTVRVDAGERGFAVREGVPTGDADAVEIVLARPGPPIAGRVAAVDDTPVVGVVVHAVRPDDLDRVRGEYSIDVQSRHGLHGPDRLAGSGRSARAAEDGTFSFGPLPPGRWIIWAGGPGDAVTPTAVRDRSADDGTPLLLPVKAGWTLRARVVGDAGAPLPGADVIVECASGLAGPLRTFRLTTRSGQGGVTTVGALPASPATVSRHRTRVTVPEQADDAEAVDIPADR